MEANKQHAHELIERLDPSLITTAVRFLEFIAMDPLTRSFVTAPVDDEPLTEEEEQALQASKQWFQHNEGIPYEQILAEFGLKPDDPPRR